MKIVIDNANGLPGGPFHNINSLNTALYNNFFGGNRGVAPQQNPPLNPAGIKPKIKTLNEDFDNYGRLLQRGGTDQSFTNNQLLTTFGQGYLDSISEIVSAGETQVWDVYNTTGDTHPWHFHLVNLNHSFNVSTPCCPPAFVAEAWTRPPSCPP